MRTHDQLVAAVHALGDERLGQWLCALNYLIANRRFLAEFGVPDNEAALTSILDAVLDEHRRRGLAVPAVGWDLTTPTTAEERAVTVEITPWLYDPPVPS